MIWDPIKPPIRRILRVDTYLVDLDASNHKIQGMPWAGAGGLARPIKFSYDGSPPGPAPTFHLVGRGPAHQFFISWVAAWPGPSFFQRMGRGSPSHFQKITARPGQAHETRPLYGPACYFRGRPVDLTGRATGRPMCCSVLKGEGIHAGVCFLL